MNYLEYPFAPKAQLSITNFMFEDINKIDRAVPGFQSSCKTILCNFQVEKKIQNNYDVCK